MTDAEIITLLSTGYTVSEVSTELNVTIRTVEYRIEILRERSKAHTVAHLVAIYLRKKLIE